MSSIDLLPLWPTDERVQECIKADADIADLDVFLAVHQPMTFVKKTEGLPDTADTHDEQELLKEFLRDTAERRVVLPIVGESGVGKSHVIRWLHAQLMSMPGNEDRHIIHIPKGTSLKRVLGMVLEGLEGPQYDEFRALLTQAKENLNPSAAAKHLQAYLHLALEQLATEASERLGKDESEDVELDKTRAVFAGPRMLRAVIDDPELWREYWYRTEESPGPIRRIAAQVTQSVEGVDERKHEFVPADFKLPDGIDPSNLNVGARGFYQKIAQVESRKADAANVLNEVLDPAKAKLLELGDNSLADLFKDVRRELHREGKELVLLVEDFAVLSGLQGALLQVMIDGGDDLCMMRSALAYTTGYMMDKTVKTRARTEWFIADRLDRDRTLARAVELTGAYLNAARWGKSKLAIARAESTTSEWIPTFELEHPEDEAARIVDIFGRSEMGYPLFPLNRAAIHRLTEENSVDAGALVYNPRFIIKNVIRPILEQRSAFENSAFPVIATGRGPKGALTDSSVITRLSQIVPQPQVERALVFTGYWGGDPETLDELGALPEELYDAVGIKVDRSALSSYSSPTAPAPKATSRKPSTPEPAPQPKPVAPTAGAKPSKTEAWRAKLQKWRRDGETLVSADANSLRKWAFSAVVDGVLWEDYLFKEPPRELSHTKIYIPRAAGAGGVTPEAALFQICTDEEFSNSVVMAHREQELLAIIEFYDEHDGSWDWAGAANAYPLFLRFVERHRERVVASVLASHRTSQAIATKVQALVLSARALGVDGAGGNRRLATLNALFADAEEPAEGLTNRWNALREKLVASRTEWVKKLTLLVGARQGIGANVFGIDVSMVHPVLDSFLKDWSLQPESEEDKEWNALRRSIESVSTEEAAAVKEVAARIWEGLGDDFDKSAVIKEIRSLASNAKKEGLASVDSIVGLRNAVDAFQKAPTQESLALANELGEDWYSDAALLGKLDYSALHKASQLVTELGGFLGQVESSIQEQRALTNAETVENSRMLLADELEQLNTLLDVYETEVL